MRTSFWGKGIATVALATAVLGGASAQAAEQSTLYLYNWTDYVSPKAIAQFEKQYHAKVVQNYFTSNAEMFSKLRSGGDAQYDVIVPTDYFVPRLVDAKLIQPLGKLEAREQIADEFLKADYDPGGRYSLPYLWGATGIIYDTQALPDIPHSWKALFDEQANPRQPFSLLGGDAQVLFGASCAALGLGFDCVGQDAWVKAGRSVSATLQRPNFQGFSDSTAAIDQVVRGVSKVAVTYSGDFDYRRDESPETYRRIGFFIPEEGSQRGVDTLAIPAHAPHPKLARAFIEFMQQPDIAALNARYSHYYTPNKGAEAVLAKQGIKAAPDKQDRDKLMFVPLLKGDQLHLLQQIWGEVRSRQ
ncbi:Spermidine/putrescine-binding periplasmic protein [Carnimonas sp. R-84981]|uniref:ABC transporter substrate-binding protein n=1 Tax=Carnimonas bestiolae TaxID=3402172 RepID=UPI003EDC4E9F